MMPPAETAAVDFADLDRDITDATKRVAGWYDGLSERPAAAGESPR
jgi:hypothetical protein